MQKEITIELPKGFMNTAVVINKGYSFFVADTNNSANWDTLKFPLPDGKWYIWNQKGKNVILKAEN